MSLSLVSERNIIRAGIKGVSNKVKSIFSQTKSITQKLEPDKIKDYAFVMFYSEEDECWVADVPDLKYCSAFGDTPEEAAKEIQVAVRGWLEGAKINGTPIPPPKYNAKHLNIREENESNEPPAQEGEQLSFEDVMDRDIIEQPEHEYA
jgi:predicted RNase H-like HicB family nuclease